MRTRTPIALSAALLLGLLAAAPATAQRTGWLPWIGCWQPADAAVDDAALCIRPLEGAQGVEVLQLEGDQVRYRELLWSDGVRHETSREGCQGWERGSFSEDGRRLFFQSEHTCDDGSVRRGAGLMALSDVNEWLDVRVLDFGGEPVAWVQRYTMAPTSVHEAVGLEDVRREQYASVRAARMAASAPVDAEEVSEAVRTLPVEAVEAWLAESGQPFDLSGEVLVEMADAGMPERVIDVMVAVSNPDYFRLGDRGDLERVERGPRAAQRVGHGPAWYGPFWWDPFYYDSFRYSPYRYGYTGFGYSPFYYGYGYRPVIISVDRTPRNHGRVVRGRGYTRPTPSSSSGGQVRSRPSSTGASAAPSSSGTRSPASSSSGGRKAKRRGGGF